MRDVPVVHVLAVLLAVLAVATAAAGFAGMDATDGDPSGDEGAGVGDGSGEGVGSGDDQGVDLSTSETVDTPVPPYLERVIAAILGLLILAFVAVILKTLWEESIWQLLSEFVTALKDSVAVVLLFGFLLALLIGVMALMSGDGGGGDVGGNSSSQPAASEGGSAVVSQPLDTPFVLLAVFVIAVVALFAIFSSSAVRSSLGLLEETTDESSTHVTRAEGRTEFDGDFSDVEPANPVYRAWLDVADAAEETDRRTSTPAEVARAAITSGLDGQAVRTITDLFAEVRYGEKPVDDERSSRARRARDELHDDRGGDA